MGVPNVCVTVNRPNVEHPERYTITRLADDLWAICVECWIYRVHNESWIHVVDYAKTHPTLLDALDDLLQCGYIYNSWEVRQYAEALIELRRNDA